MPTKKYLRKKAKEICRTGQIVIKKSQLSEVLTELSNPRAVPAVNFPVFVFLSTLNTEN